MFLRSFELTGQYIPRLLSDAILFLFLFAGLLQGTEMSRKSKIQGPTMFKLACTY